MTPFPPSNPSEGRVQLNMNKAKVGSKRLKDKTLEERGGPSIHMARSHGMGSFTYWSSPKDAPDTVAMSSSTQPVKEPNRACERNFLPVSFFCVAHTCFLLV